MTEFWCTYVGRSFVGPIGLGLGSSLCPEVIALAAAAKHDGALLAMGLVKLSHDRKHFCCLVSRRRCAMVYFRMCGQAGRWS